MKKLCILLPIVILLGLVGCQSQDYWHEDLHLNNLEIHGSLVRYDDTGNGGYWFEYGMPALVLSKGGSGATERPPDGNTLGGYRLDADDEYLYYGLSVSDDWDDVSDLTLRIAFEVNVDNTGGNADDRVVFSVDGYYKSVGDTSSHVCTCPGEVVVGQAERYKMFICELQMPMAAEGVVDGDTIILRLNLDTLEGDIGSVIVNYVEVTYQAIHPQQEVD